LKTEDGPEEVSTIIKAPESGLKSDDGIPLPIVKLDGPDSDDTIIVKSPSMASSQLNKICLESIDSNPEQAIRFMMKRKKPEPDPELVKFTFMNCLPLINAPRHSKLTNRRIIPRRESWAYKLMRNQANASIIANMVRENASRARRLVYYPSGAFVVNHGLH